ncbi:hypothetical protein BDY21DRAFT_334860 [Lineolata rhizophorae]|uniref:Uncharacterized protein n=1 Tax=Lineolata rhizophorae TaxID=578093 RepID=A0A6A6P8S4_9PEZI|nr:hypothetical protein BDY21DRAFT_334860 [Lineolata rhizophorae]
MVMTGVGVSGVCDFCCGTGARDSRWAACGRGIGCYSHEALGGKRRGDSSGGCGSNA